MAAEKATTSSTLADHEMELSSAQKEFEVSHKNSKFRYMIKTMRRSRPDAFQLTDLLIKISFAELSDNESTPLLNVLHLVNHIVFHLVEKIHKFYDNSRKRTIFFSIHSPHLQSDIYLGTGLQNGG